MTSLWIAALLFMTSMAVAPAPIRSVRDFGAVGDGATKDTAAIQSAIDAASSDGGGEVYVPAGRYLTGTIRLKDHVTLNLAPGSTLLGSPDVKDFAPYEKLGYDPHADVETSYFHFGLVTADGARDIAIVGEGEIDGNRKRRGGPKTIALKNCRNVTIRGVRVKNSPNYSISFLGCDYVNVEGVHIENGYADGIDPDCSRYVRIADCFIDSTDDSICLKTSLALGERRSTEHVAITNCVITSSNNAFKCGTESSGDFKNVSLSNCSMFRKEGRGTDSGIAIESVDGSNIDGIVISNVSMQNVQNPIFVRLGNRGRGLTPPVPGSLQNVSISNIVATGARSTCSISGLKGCPARRVALDNIQIEMNGGDTTTHTLNVPEQTDKYPEHEMFGPLPAYGLYLRHAEDIMIRNFRVGWSREDHRHAVVADDVSTLTLDGLQIFNAAGAKPVIDLTSCRGVVVSNCRLNAPASCFVHATGTTPKDLRLIGNEVSSARTTIRKDAK